MADSISKDIEITKKMLKMFSSKQWRLEFTEDDKRVACEALESWLEILNVADSTSDEVDD